MRVQAQASILLAFGTTMVQLARSNGLVRYVNPTSRPWVLAAGAVMVVMGGLLLTSRPKDEAGFTYSPVAWVLLAPLVVVVLLAPPALGSFTALHSRPVDIKPSEADYPALGHSPPGGAIELTLLDFASRGTTHAGHSLAGRQVRVTGFSLGPSADGLVLGRLVITCCAADAAPVAIDVQTSQPVPERDVWVTVIGTFAGVEAGRHQRDSSTVRLAAVSVAVVVEPSDPYEH